LGTTVKIRLGPFKGYRGPVVEVKGNSVRVELEMKIVTGKPLNSLLRVWVSTCRTNSNNSSYMQLIGVQYQIMLRQHRLEIHLGIVWEAKHLCILHGLHFILI
jgi:transcription elongation factor SPT5